MSNPKKRFQAGRHAGVLVPLFSIPSGRSWGIGEILDIPVLAAWLRQAGQDLLQLLPVNEMGGGDHSPYSAMSAMAIDPIFISVHALEDFHALGGEPGLEPQAREVLASVRASRRVEYDQVRPLKEATLAAAFERFYDVEWRSTSTRARALMRYREQQAWWLDDYALFRALLHREKGQWWRLWETALRTRRPAALLAAQDALQRDVLYRQYLQWIADCQWQEARQEAGVGIFGDFPFMVSGNSADVWARQDEFRFDASVGVPPDAFSKTGQNWGLPVYRWQVIRERGFEWLRQRARRSAALYDGYRVDHLVGFYRTYVRPTSGARPYFDPGKKPDQTALGEEILAILAAAGPRIIAEDLGTVPEFVRQSLARLRVPGYKVLRWERAWEEVAKGQPFYDPERYPTLSVVTSGTHDTDTLADWWDGASRDEREEVGRIPFLARTNLDFAEADYSEPLGDLLLELLYRSPSELLILPIQDLFGWRDRINTPATQGQDNWSYRLPWPVDQMSREPEVQRRTALLRRWAVANRRGS